MAFLPRSRDLGERREVDIQEGERGCVFTRQNSRVCKRFYSSHFSVCLANKYLSYYDPELLALSVHATGHMLGVLPEGEPDGPPLGTTNFTLCREAAKHQAEAPCVGGSQHAPWVCDEGQQPPQHLASSIVLRNYCSEPVRRPSWAWGLDRPCEFNTNCDPAREGASQVEGTDGLGPGSAFHPLSHSDQGQHTVT